MLPVGIPRDFLLDTAGISGIFAVRAILNAGINNFGQPVEIISSL